MLVLDWLLEVRKDILMKGAVLGHPVAIEDLWHYDCLGKHGDDVDDDKPVEESGQLTHFEFILTLVEYHFGIRSGVDDASITLLGVLQSGSSWNELFQSELIRIASTFELAVILIDVFVWLNVSQSDLPGFQQRL